MFLIVQLREFSLDSRFNTREIFGIILRDPLNRRVCAFRLSKVRRHRLFRDSLSLSPRSGVHFFPRTFVKEEKIRTRGPGAKTVMCRLNVNGDSHLFQPLGAMGRGYPACVCTRVTSHTRVRAYARLTREKSARVLYECHGE